MEEITEVLDELERIFEAVYWRTGFELCADVFCDGKIEVVLGPLGEFDIPFSEWMSLLIEDEQIYVLFNIDLFADIS